MRYCLFFCLLLTAPALFSQKMLLLERAYSARTTKLLVGQKLTFSLAGDKKYWYERTITDILPESNMLLLDNFPVKLTDIVALRVKRNIVLRRVGATLFAFGGSLVIATTGAALFQDRDTRYGLLYATSAGCLATGYALNTHRTLNLGETHQLRIVEIRFSAP